MGLNITSSIPMKIDKSRKIEGSLLFFVGILLLAGFTLVLAAKLMHGLPSDAINLNTASSEKIAYTLGIDPGLADLLVQRRDKIGGFTQTHQPSSLPLLDQEKTEIIKQQLLRTHLNVSLATTQQFEKLLNLPQAAAQRIVQYRTGLTGGIFTSEDIIFRIPFVANHVLTAADERVYVRTPLTVFTSFVLCAGCILLALFFSAWFIRWRGVQGDPFLVPLVWLLAGLGVILLFSVKDPLRDTPVYIHQTFGLILACAALIAGALLPAQTRRNLRHYSYLWALSGMLLIIALYLHGYGPGGSRLTLWFFQPLEVVKLLFMLFTAGYLSSRSYLLAEANRRWSIPLMPKGSSWKAALSLPRKEDIAPLIGIYAGALFLLVIVRDLGPALLIFGAFLGCIYLSTGRTGVVWMGLLMIASCAILGKMLHIGVIPVRIDMWLSPWNNRWERGMQLGQAIWGMATGGIAGAGLGLGMPGTMPRAGSDLIFATLGEDLGLTGTLSVLILFVVLIQRGLKIGFHCQNDFDRILVSGLTALLACQVFLITAGVTGLLPLAGITLPFMAFGNSSLVIDFFLIGLIRGVSSPTGSAPVGSPRPALVLAFRRFSFVVAFALLGLVGIVRLVWIQGIRDQIFASTSITTPDEDGIIRPKINPRLVAVADSIPRGSIFDRSGHLLATSRLEEIVNSLNGDFPQAKRYFTHGRYYPYGRITANIVGYEDTTLGGPTGAEREFNHDLRGFDNYGELLSDYRDMNLPAWLTGYHPKIGKDVSLTIDADLQQTAYALLNKKLAAINRGRIENKYSSGAVVALDPSSGEVLVSCSIPAFDPNHMTAAMMKAVHENIAKSSETGSPFFDRSRYGMYPPGSSIKVAVASAALQAGLNPRYYCDHVDYNVRWAYQGQVYSRRKIQDDNGDPPHHMIGMGRALEVSCNIYYAHLGLKLGVDRLYHTFADPDRFSLSGVEQPSIFARDLPDNAYGQGTMRVSPTEMARIAAAIANKGVMMTPCYWKTVSVPGGVLLRSSQPVIMSVPIDAANAAKVAIMMRSVVTGGTARGLFDDIPVEVAGKTGTAQTKRGNGHPDSWFMGFAPYSNPQIAFSCIVENGGYGNKAAASVIDGVLKQRFGK
jgi:cell division protein FtsI/penicillin-binding protein 2/cell division protein FtsW (lipid II flippase)/DNA uptake protein ComE-like DNA-binding protein